MRRRAFLMGSAAAAWAAIEQTKITGQSPGRTRRPVGVVIDSERKLGTIPREFVGLGYEISSVAVPGLLSAANRTYVQLVQTLSPTGVIRVGGNTSDDAMFAAEQEARSAPKGTVVNDATLRELGTFLGATNWRLIWGLNLGSTDEKQAAAEAEAVTAAAGDRLLAFEIGNEPDLFGRGAGAHRPATYSYEAFLEEYRRYKTVIRARLPKAQFAGPDVASATDWVTRFAGDEGSDLRLLTHHYYRECASASSTLDKLLQVDPKLGPELARLRAAGAGAKLPYRICETNSFCGGGKPGVSDTFGAALWVLDFMFTLAYAGCAGVNMETGVNQLGFVSSYSPIRTNERGGDCSAAAEYYGMLAFAHGSTGQLLAVDLERAGVNVNAFATVTDSERGGAVTIVNKDESVSADVRLSIPSRWKMAQVFRLSGPSLESKESITFGGSAVSAEGRWEPGTKEILRADGGSAAIQVPAGSAAVLKWMR